MNSINDDGLNISAIEALATEAAPLYRHYAGQCQAQDAYIEIDEDGAIDAGYNAEIGNRVPVCVWYGCTLRFRAPQNLSGRGLLALVEEHRELFARVNAGHIVEWDGSNHVGRLTDDAREAKNELEDTLYQQPGDVTICDADEYLWSNCSLADHWSEGSIDAVVERIGKYAASEGDIITGDIRESLLARAENMLDERPETLARCHIDALLAEGRLDAEQAAEWIAEYNAE